MNKLILFCLSLFFISQAPLEAQWFGALCRRPCCYRYMDVTIADYDCAPYGYVDNINYPEPYYLPLNYYFRGRRPCRYDQANYNYLMECIHFNNSKPCTN